MSEFTTFRRWTLKDGRQESEVVSLIQDSIVPAYKKLTGCKRLGLLRVEGTRSYLATQHWESHAAHSSATVSADYASWLESYTPSLNRWHEIMALEDEWATAKVL